MAKLAGGSFMAVRFKREEKDLKKRMTREVKMTLIAILRRSSIVDTIEPREIDMACSIQEQIVKRIERELAR